MTRDKRDGATLDMFSQPGDESLKGCYSPPKEPEIDTYDADPVLTKIGDIVEHVLDAATSAPRAPAGVPAAPDDTLIQLKLWPLALRSSPNAILRATVFRAITGRYRRSSARYERVASVGSLRRGERMEVEAMGPELCQYDHDVWLTVEQIAAEQPLGMLVQFTQAAFLRAMGRKNPGKADRDLLFQSLSRLRAHTLRVTINGRYDYVGGLLMQLSRDQITGRYQVQLDPQLHKLFSHGWTRLDHTVRAALAGKPLAQWLTAFYATHAKPYPMKVTTLHELSGSHTDDLKRFRQSLCEALDQITVLDAAGRGVRPTPGLKGRKRRRAASIDFFAYWRIDGDDLVHVIRNPRYLHEKQLQIARGETSNEAETAELDEVATHEDNEAGDDFFD